MDEHESNPFDSIATQSRGALARLTDFYQAWAQVTSDAPTPLAAQRQELLSEYRRRMNAIAAGMLMEPPAEA